MTDTTNHCPLCEGYSKRIQSLGQDRDRLREFLEEIGNSLQDSVDGRNYEFRCRARALLKDLEGKS